jgi:hypothetical protein
MAMGCSLKPVKNSSIREAKRIEVFNTSLSLKTEVFQEYLEKKNTTSDFKE